MTASKLTTAVSPANPPMEVQARNNKSLNYTCHYSIYQVDSIQEFNDCTGCCIIISIADNCISNKGLLTTVEIIAPALRYALKRYPKTSATRHMSLHKVYLHPSRMAESHHTMLLVAPKLMSAHYQPSNQSFLMLSFRFVTPFVRISVAVALPLIGCPLTKTWGAENSCTPFFASASSLCSSLNSFSSLSLRSSSATLKKTKRYAIRKIAQSQNRFRACRLASSAVEM